MDRNRTIGGLALLKAAFMGREEETAILDSAIEMLKAWEPTKPVQKDAATWLCAYCDETVGKDEPISGGGMIMTRCNFCPWCGRAVKWA